MTTYQSLTDSTLAYNADAHWSRNHQLPYWSLSVSDTHQPAVIDGFGDLIPAPWSIQ